jgi:hypothetical protein
LYFVQGGMPLCVMIARCVIGGKGDVALARTIASSGLRWGMQYDAKIRIRIGCYTTVTAIDYSR